MDENALRNEIKQAREAEMKAKTQIYTLRGKKGLQAMAAAMGEELPPQLSETVPIYEDPEDSPQIQELRRQIALLREMEQQQRNHIEELKQKKATREQGSQGSAPELVEMPRVQESNIHVQQAKSFSLAKAEPAATPVPAYAQPAKVPSYVSMSQEPSTPEPVSRAPPPATSGPPPPVVSQEASNNSIPILPQATASPSGSGIVSPRNVSKSKRGKKDKVSMQSPDSLDTKVLNASWDSGSAKSKKANKVYTIQVTMNGVTWKIIRGDDMLCELSKRLSKAKAEGSPLPPLVKKVVKREQQAELAGSVQTYLNQIQTNVVFGPKKDKTKAAFLKFFAPFSSRDEGMGNFPGGTSDPEGWFIWKLGLGE